MVRALLEKTCQFKLALAATDGKNKKPPFDGQSRKKEPASRQVLFDFLLLLVLIGGREQRTDRKRDTLVLLIDVDDLRVDFLTLG